jgi:Uma2 family endonuclease
VKTLPTSHGPFLARYLSSGDPYELSNGHAIQCLPTGARGSKAEGAGYKVIDTDPGAGDVGIDTGYSPAPDTLRAPDLSAGEIPDEPGWVEGVPRLAVEYADTGQDEGDLAAKIRELLGAGTELIWVVRLQGPRRVEVHRPGEPMAIAHPGDELEARGILRHRVPVEALYDHRTADKLALRNLLEKEEGYESLDQVRAESALETLRDGLLAVLETRGLELDDEQRAAIAECGDPARLRRWLIAAATASSAQAALGT